MCIGLHVKYPSFLSDFNETLIFLAEFGRILKYQILRTSPSSGNRVVLCGQKNLRTYGHEEANSRFSQLYECTYKLNVIGRAVQNKIGKSIFET